MSSARAVWKFPLAYADLNTVEMPKGSYVLSAQLQNGVVTLWALVDPYEEKAPRQFRILGTGDSTAPSFEGYVGTVQVGAFVWHVFEVAR